MNYSLLLLSNYLQGEILQDEQNPYGSNGDKLSVSHQSLMDKLHKTFPKSTDGQMVLGSSN